MKLGGYRQLKSFQHAELVYDSTVKFCDRFIDRRSRQLEKAFLQEGGFTERLLPGAVGCKKRRAIGHIAPVRPILPESMDYLPDNVRRAYHDLAGDPRYRHFVRIPDRIIQCIDYFGIEFDRTAARTSLHAYYLFIGVVDDAIDSGKIDAGRLILEYLNTPAPVFDEAARRSSVRLITEILKSNINDQTYPLTMDKLRELYCECVSERSAASIDSYLEHRKAVGSLTAEVSYVLILPALSGEHAALCRFMKEVGAIGCLVDSLIDLRADRRLGLLGFKPRISDYARLLVNILRDGLRVSLKHPGLAGLFLQAIGDNVQDRFRAGPNFAQPSFASERKVEPVSVA